MEMNMFGLSGLGGILLLALDIWALVSILGSGATSGRKALWVLLVFLLPLIGFVVWLIAGPRARRS